jgi:uncharacterized protein YlxW (UPF0749 family)
MTDDMSKVMVTLKLDPEHASVDSARDMLGIDNSAIDRDFGVIAVSPEEDLYAVLVDAGAAEDMHTGDGIAGPYSNPRIEPFGPPQRADGAERSATLGDAARPRR